MKAFTRISGVAAPFMENDVNTDQIAPVGGGARMSEDYAETFFRHRRRRSDGSEDPDFIFNRPQFRRPAIVVTGVNFGCGSSRESAVWVFAAIGVSCIIARSFADIYRENCVQNGILPIVLGDADASRMEAAVIAADGRQTFDVDLTTKRITGPDGLSITFEIPESDRIRLLEGLDDIGLTLKHLSEIQSLEQKLSVDLPWSQHADIARL
jgi:3-isopropylmalate/(R)-2-methylmalate dehydratase small subunit